MTNQTEQIRQAFDEKECYETLMQLCETNDSFYYKDVTEGSSKYRIFNYNLASYSDFQKPYAKFARGIMFETFSENLVPILVCLPMPKFFNLNENPETIGLDLSKIVAVEPKYDGSLISTYINYYGEMAFKSKESLDSVQVIEATKWINLPENNKFREQLEVATLSGYTVNLEWISPDNRVVLSYDNSQLVVLNIIDTMPLYMDELYVDIPEELKKFARPAFKPENIEKFVKSVASMTDSIEGFIYVFEGGKRVKHKTDKYMSLHHVKDSVTNPRRLFQAVVDGGADDLRGYFAKDEESLKLIEEMDKFVSGTFNAMFKEVENFYRENKTLERKDFASKAKTEVTPLYFGLVMNLYVERENDYKNFFKGKWKELGIRDTSATK
jgi:RNA ligase